MMCLGRVSVWALLLRLLVFIYSKELRTLSAAAARPANQTVMQRDGHQSTANNDDGARRRPPIPSAITSIWQAPRDPVYLWSSLFAGVSSAALASILCAPLDLVRTRLQVWSEVKHATTITTAAVPQLLRDIVRNEGVTGLFRGLGATLITVPAFWGIYFPLYDDLKRHWTRIEQERAAHCVVPRRRHPALVHCGSAVAAGLVADVLCNPMFVVRTRLQTQALHASVGERSTPVGIITTIQSLWAEGGLFIFWRGMTANLLGLAHVALQFPIYEELKRYFKAHKSQESPLDLLVASGLSKMTASFVTYPHEVIRSRMMDARTAVGFGRTCVRIYSLEGVSGFYAGLPISLMRVIPNTCITFLTYELFLRWSRAQIMEYRSSSSNQERQ